MKYCNEKIAYDGGKLKMEIRNLSPLKYWQSNVKMINNYIKVNFVYMISMNVKKRTEHLLIN